MPRLTIAEYARRMGISRPTVYRLAAAGRITIHRPPGGPVYIDTDDQETTQ